jgi:hypothetical protein
MLLPKPNDFDQKTERPEFGMFILNHLQKQKLNGRSVLPDPGATLITPINAFEKICRQNRYATTIPPMPHTGHSRVAHRSNSPDVTARSKSVKLSRS